MKEKNPKTIRPRAALRPLTTAEIEYAQAMANAVCQGAREISSELKKSTERINSIRKITLVPDHVSSIREQWGKLPSTKNKISAFDIAKEAHHWRIYGPGRKDEVIYNEKSIPEERRQEAAIRHATNYVLYDLTAGACASVGEEAKMDQLIMQRAHEIYLSNQGNHSDPDLEDTQIHRRQGPAVDLNKILRQE